MDLLEKLEAAFPDLSPTIGEGATLEGVAIACAIQQGRRDVISFIRSLSHKQPGAQEPGGHD